MEKVGERLEGGGQKEKKTAGKTIYRAHQGPEFVGDGASMRRTGKRNRKFRGSKSRKVSDGEVDVTLKKIRNGVGIRNCTFGDEKRDLHSHCANNTPKSPTRPSRKPVKEGGR